LRYPLIYKHRYPALLIFVVAITYLPYLGNDFIFDDLHSLSDIVLDFFAARWQSPRWLPQATLSWTASIFSNAVPHFFHLGNVTLHGINAILVFYLLRQLLWLSDKPDDNHIALYNFWAWTGALVFACHPVAVYAAGYISQRSILLATLFGLIMQIAYIRAMTSGEKRWLSVAVMAYFAAIFCKEHSVMLHATLMISSVLFHHRNKLSPRSMTLTLLALITVALFLILKIKGIIGVAYEPLMSGSFESPQVINLSPDIYLSSLLTQTGLFFKYVLLWLIPNPAWMSADMRETLVPSIKSWQSVIGAIAFLAYGAVSLWLLCKRGRVGLLGFALLYPWLHFLVEFSTVRVQEPFVLYRSYLWMTGAVAIVPLILERLKKNRLLPTIVVIAAILITISWNRLGSLSSNYRLWDDAAKLISKDTPGADRIYFNRGQSAAKLHLWDKASEDLKLVTSINPRVSIARYELGMAYLNLGKNTEALHEFDIGIQLSPEDGSLHLGKGLALLRLGKKKEGQGSINKACELNDGTACLLSTTKNQKNLTN
jgi:hypothetical protein